MKGSYLDQNVYLKSTSIKKLNKKIHKYRNILKIIIHLKIWNKYKNWSFNIFASHRNPITHYIGSSFKINEKINPSDHS
jgi:hypothetical protein